MDRSQKGFVASTSSSAKSSISDETDENETILDRIDSKSQSCKRNLHKRFMSPTLSATTKASIPRKKILSDKNSLNLEDGDTFYTEKPSIRSILANYCTSESDGDEHHTFASKPYDPLTNYLSPRPKYLRYNPNRRRKIFDLEESIEENKDNSRLFPPVGHFASQKVVDEQDLLEGSGDSVISSDQEGKVEDDSSLLPPVSCFVSQNVVDEQESSMEGNSKAIQLPGGIAKPGDQKQLGKEEYDGNNPEQLGKVEDDYDDDDQEEEFEEKRRCSLKGIVKFMVLLIAIAFSTSYMSPMNNVGLQVQNHSFGNYSFNVQQEAGQMDFMNLKLGNNFSDFRGGYTVLQDVDEGVEMTDDIWKKHAYDPINELSNKLSDAKSLEIEKLDSDHQTDLKGVQSQLSEISEIASETIQVLEEGSDHGDFPEEKNEPLDSERIVTHFEKEKDADLIDDVNEMLEIHQNKQDGDVVQQKGEDIVKEPGFSSQEQTRESVQDETSLSTLMHNIGQTGSIEDGGKSIEDLHHGSYQSALMENDFIGCDEKSTEAIVSIPGGIAPAYIVVSLLILALSFLVYMYAPVKRSKQVTVPLEESVDIKHMHLKPPTAHFLSQEVVKEENSYIQAPNVEFLGELVIDEVYSSHRRRSEYKHDKTIDSNHVERSTQGSYVDMIDEVYSSHRSGYKHDKAIKSNHMENSTKGSYDINVLPSCSIDTSYSSIEESTTAESPSYGSFTAGKKISKKQGSRDRTLATPVRRSSRIRNLTFTSP